MGNNLCPGSSGNNTSLSRSYTFDGFNQLVSVKNGANADIAQYSYYPDGLRRSKTVNGTTENYINQDGNAVAIVDANGNITAGYLYALFVFVHKKIEDFSSSIFCVAFLKPVIF